MTIAIQVKLIEWLNILLAAEYAAIQQYEFHKAWALRRGLTKYVAYAQEHIDDESKHAQKLRDLINLRGGVPVTMPSKVNTASVLPDQLRNDRGGEEQAIGDYSTVHALALSLKDPDAARVCQENLADEWDHYRDITAYQAQIDLMTLPNWVSTLS